MSARPVLVIVLTFSASMATVVNPSRVLRSAADTLASPVPIVIVKALFPLASSNGLLPTRSLTLCLQLSL